MDEYTGLDGRALSPAGSYDADAINAQAARIPWLPGTLLRFVGGGSVLDIKTPGTAAAGPVVPGATVTTWLPSGPAEDQAGQDARCYDAIFARDALAVADDPHAALAAWFARLRAGGHLLLLMPHAETAAGHDHPAPHAAAAGAPPGGDVTGAPPGDNFTAAPRRGDFTGTTVTGTTPEALMRMVEAALPAGRFAVRQFDTAAEIHLVLQKLATSVPPRTAGMRAEGNLLLWDFAPRPATVARILVLKLDHRGDFLIGLPALRELRQYYKGAYIRLVCGRWNLAAARAAGVADDIRSFDYFPERAADRDGAPARTDWSLFAKATEGHFDIAIDMRVDEDTRALLARINAQLRCGIGSQARFPMLDIALPDTSREVPRPAKLGNIAGIDIGVSNFGAAYIAAAAAGAQVIAPDAFRSEMEIRTRHYHETGFPAGETCVLRSDDICLPAGFFSASFDLSARHFVPGLAGVGVKIEVIADGERIIAGKAFGRRSISRLNARTATIEFESVGGRNHYEFRVHIGGRPLAGRVRFAGLCLRRLDGRGARLRPSELHVGEKLSLLVSLIRQRTLPLAALPPSLPEPAPPRRRTDRALHIVVAPFSNSTVRDWPAEYYAALIRMITERYECRVRLVGAPGQAVQAARLIGRLPAATRRERVTDLVGKTQWDELPDILRAADLVICNNSGIAHQAASLGVRILAVFSASHQPPEWGPRGQHARAMMMSVACSPCGLERVEDCGLGHLCMRTLTPEIVMAQVAQLLSGAGQEEAVLF